MKRRPLLCDKKKGQSLSGEWWKKRHTRLSFTFGSALCSIRNLTIPLCPPSHAQCSGVHFCGKKPVNPKTMRNREIRTSLSWALMLALCSTSSFTISPCPLRQAQ
jgi:hypothetical protein